MTTTKMLTRSRIYKEYDDSDRVERYDLIDDVRENVKCESRLHNRIVARVTAALLRFEDVFRTGKCYPALSDILVSIDPVRTRKPDAMFMGAERTLLNAPEYLDHPIVVAPELIIEVLSNNHPRTAFGDVLADYSQIGVEECWLVGSEGCTIEVLQLVDECLASTAIYGISDKIKSVVFPDLEVIASDIFVD